MALSPRDIMRIEGLEEQVARLEANVARHAQDAARERRRANYFYNRTRKLEAAIRTAVGDERYPARFILSSLVSLVPKTPRLTLTELRKKARR